MRKQNGVVLLSILLFVLMTTMAAGAMVQMYQTQTQREKEEQLLFVGDQYRQAIASYYNTIPPGSARTLPSSLDALLSDERLPTPVQHLRRMYEDPMTGTKDWDLFRRVQVLPGSTAARRYPLSKPLVSRQCTDPLKARLSTQIGSS
jgi:type II secretory pathway pseudopilin PulG